MAKPPPKRPMTVTVGLASSRDPSPAPRTEWINFRPVRHLPDEGACPEVFRRVNRPMLIAAGVLLAALALGVVWLAGPATW